MSTSFNNLSVGDLRKAANIKEKIEALELELSQLLGNGSAAPAKGKRGGGGMSAAGRAAVIAAQKARWAKFHSAQGTKPGPKPGRKKHKMSAAGRAAIAAAQKARWAKAKAGK